MQGRTKIQPHHLNRRLYIYVRQSSPGQVVSHPESARRQRELRQLGLELGWPASRIVVLDTDLGKSGQAAEGRDDFKQIVDETSEGHAGMILGLEVSRLARNNADWFPLIEMCGLTRTLVGDGQGVYDPNDSNDRLMLGFKGTMSEAELVQMRIRLHGGRWSLARRGALRRKIPVGYTWDERGRVVMDPDERVRSAIRGFFARFEEMGSARAVSRGYARDGLVFPMRSFRGRWEAPVVWKPLQIRQATQMLNNPFYAGVYFYGRHRAVTVLDPQTKSRRTKLERKPMEAWEVFIRDAHPAYISYGAFTRNRQRLRDNWMKTQGGPGAVRSGKALLQGVVYCARCGRSMGVRYIGRQSTAYYTCGIYDKTGEFNYCGSVSAGRVDEWVAGEILAVIEPLGIEAALEAVEELERRSEEVRRQWEHRIKAAEYDVALARRRYEAVDPENRLVAANLERAWEEGLRVLEQARQEFAERASRPPISISEEDRMVIRDLAEDLPRLWRAKSTKMEDRKKIVRILIRDVWLAQENEPWRTLGRIHWRTGAVNETYLERPLPVGDEARTPETTVERLRELLASDLSREEIAEQLNREGLRTGRKRRFTKYSVAYLVKSRKLRAAGSPSSTET